MHPILNCLMRGRQDSRIHPVNYMSPNSLVLNRVGCTSSDEYVVPENYFSVFVNVIVTGWYAYILIGAYTLCLKKDINISQGSVATLVRCGGKINANFIANFLTSQPVKELWKSADIWRSYCKRKRGTFFETQCSYTVLGNGNGALWWACMSVCLFARISQEPHVKTSPNFRHICYL